MEDKKYQILNFSFTAQNQEIEKEIDIDERYNYIEKIFFADEFYYSRAQIELLQIDKDSSIFEKGIWIAFFQTFLNQNGVDINREIPKKAKIRVKLKDNTTGAFTAHNVQVAVLVSKE